MNEMKKLAEARFNYERLCTEIDDRKAFEYDLSAFLSSARSVLQYACKEAKTKQGGQQWYERQVTGNAVLSFFKDKRDLNIHTEPVRPSTHISISASVGIGIDVSASAELRDAQGNIKGQSSSETTQSVSAAKSAPTPASVKISYYFSDWSGSEDVLDLCQKYLNELELVVRNGIRDGFVTG